MVDVLNETGDDMKIKVGVLDRSSIIIDRPLTVDR
jgi:hypothetical protein